MINKITGTPLHNPNYKPLVNDHEIDLQVKSHVDNVLKSPADVNEIKDVLESMSLETGEMAKIYFDDNSDSIENTLASNSKEVSRYKDEVIDNLKTMNRPVFTNSKSEKQLVTEKELPNVKGNNENAFLDNHYHYNVFK